MTQTRTWPWPWPWLLLGIGALYQSNLQNFVRTCEEAAPSLDLEILCRDEVEVLRRFPECGADCRHRTARFVRSGPTR